VATACLISGVGVAAVLILLTQFACKKKHMIEHASHAKWGESKKKREPKRAHRGVAKQQQSADDFFKNQATASTFSSTAREPNLTSVHELSP